MTKSEKWQIRIVILCGLYFVIRCLVGCEAKAQERIWCDTVYIGDGVWRHAVVNCDTFRIVIHTDSNLLWYSDSFNIEFLYIDTIAPDTVFGTIVYKTTVEVNRIKYGFNVPRKVKIVAWDDGYWFDGYFGREVGIIKDEDIINFIPKP